MAQINKQERDRVVERYTNSYEIFGYSQEALGWGKKGRQRLRYEVLSSYWEVEGKRIVDLGAGFGDLFNVLSPRNISSYVGIELTPCLVHQGNLLYSNDPRFELRVGDVSGSENIPECDIVIISGLFNFELKSMDNYEFIQSVLNDSVRMAADGVAANFVTDRVDYHKDPIFYASPERILDIGLSITRRVVLRADYMPFEFSIYLDSRSEYDPSVAVFKDYPAHDG